MIWKKGTFSFINWANNWLKGMSSERETFSFWTVAETFCIRQRLQKRLLIGKNTLGNRVDDTTGSEVA